MKSLAILIILTVGLSACGQPASDWESVAVPGWGGPFPQPKPNPPPTIAQTIQIPVAKPTSNTEQSAQQSALKSPSSRSVAAHDLRSDAGEASNSLLFGTAITAEEAVRRTIQALAWKDELELALVAPSLTLPDAPTRAVPGYKISRSEHFTPARANDWNELSLQPPVEVGDILVRTTEHWSDDETHFYAYLVRRGETGWAVLSRALFNNLVS